MCYLAQLVGYRHAGVPIRLVQRDMCKELYLKESINDIPAGFLVVAPHILYQVGSLVHVFPVMGTNEYSEEDATVVGGDS